MSHSNFNLLHVNIEKIILEMATYYKIIIACLLFYIVLGFISKGKYRQTESECLESIYKTAFFGQSDYFCEQCIPCPKNQSFCDCPLGFYWKITQGRRNYSSNINCFNGKLDSYGNCIEQKYLKNGKIHYFEDILFDYHTELLPISELNLKLLILALLGIANSVLLMTAVFAIVILINFKKQRIISLKPKCNSVNIV